MVRQSFRTGLLLLFFTVCTAAGGQQDQFRVEIVVEGIDHPWAVAFLPDGDALVTERAGRLHYVTDGVATIVPGTPEVAPIGQGGLLDVLLHPRFEENGWVYLTYSTEHPREIGRFATALGRGRLLPGPGGAPVLEDFQELFVANNWAGGGRHFGSRIVFGSDGLIYMTIGDRGQRERAQDPADHAGSVLRLDEAGQPAPGNPRSSSNLSGELAPGIFTTGHRNAQGIAVHSETGDIWTHEHGPRGGDEINILRAGANYGWPVITHGREYSGGAVGDGITAAPGLEQPLIHWTPSIAPSGMAFHDGDLYVGALVRKHVRRVVLDGSAVTGEEELLRNELGRIRDIRSGPDGYLYVLTDEDRGGLYRLVPR